MALRGSFLQCELPPLPRLPAPCSASSRYLSYSRRKPSTRVEQHNGGKSLGLERRETAVVTIFTHRFQETGVDVIWTSTPCAGRCTGNRLRASRDPTHARAKTLVVLCPAETAARQLVLVVVAADRGGQRLTPPPTPQKAIPPRACLSLYKTSERVFVAEWNGDGFMCQQQQRRRQR